VIHININGINLKKLKLIGRGTQGKVYLLDSHKCIKVFKSKKDCTNEVKTLLMAQGDLHFPKLYEFGFDYIIREYINGIELNKYLLKENLTSEISSKLIELYEAIVKIGYLRKDTAIFHILVTPSYELKLIDTAKAMKKKTNIPNLLISGLDNVGYKEYFFNYLKISRPDLYTQWIKYKKKKYKKMF
jgi:RIO-like serine/threonine protein kinase